MILQGGNFEKQMGGFFFSCCIALEIEHSWRSAKREQGGGAGFRFAVYLELLQLPRRGQEP